MLTTILAALLPILVTLCLGYGAAWDHDFNGQQATLLNRMVMRYALPLSLFAGMAETRRSALFQQMPLVLSVGGCMLVGYLLVYLASRYIFRREPMTAALQALSLSGPAVPFVGSAVLAPLFGSASSLPIAVAALAMNLIQVPVTMLLLAAGQSSAGVADKQPPSGMRQQVGRALREPVVWAPLLALLLILCGLHLPPLLAGSLDLLGRSTGGVALFASGIILYSRKVALNTTVAISVLVRNLLMPLALLCLLRVLHQSPVLIRESVLTMAIPTASIPVILAVQYQVAEQEMASVLFFSTAASLVSMGAFIWITG